MTLTVADVAGRLAARTHPERAASWDAVGLQVGDPGAAVRSVAVVHEVTEAVTVRLLSDPVDLVVSYHPLLFRPVARMVPDRSPSGRAVRLLTAGVAVVVTHSDFDAMAGGMSDAMAEALDLTDVTGFAPVVPAEQAKIVTFAPSEAVGPLIDAMAAAGAGRIGDYERCAFTVHGVGRFVAGGATSPVVGAAGTANEEPEARIEMVAPQSRVDAVITALVGAHPYEEPAFDIYPAKSNQLAGGRIGAFGGSWTDLVDLVTTRFRPDGLRLSGLDGGQPRRVAVSPGAGESRIDPAVAARCDVLVSGDISHHSMVEANDRGLAIIDPGHAASERPGMARLLALVEQVLIGDVARVVPESTLHGAPTPD